MKIPLGAAVRYNGALAKVVPKPKQHDRGRGWTAIEFDGVPGTRLVRGTSLKYIAKRYEAAKAWERLGQ